jgi:CDP-glucose 4,6-dehydratase
VSGAALVTGAGGFIGSHVARSLLDSGRVVVVIERDTPSVSGLDLQGIRTRVERVRGDLLEEGVVARAIAEYGVTEVYHLAAQALVGVANRAPLSTWETNVRGTWLLLEACRRTPGVTAVVVASSDKAYGRHETLPYTEAASALAAQYPYDVSKACADLIARSYAATFGLPVVVTRCANVYGPGDANLSRLVPELALAAARGTRPVIRSDGSPERGYLYIDDCVRAYRLLAGHAGEDGVRGEAFNVGGGEPISVLDLVATVLDVAGRGDLEPVVLGTARGEIDRQYLDSGKIAARLGFAPEWTLEAGLRETVKWYAAQAYLFPDPAGGPP